MRLITSALLLLLLLACAAAPLCAAPSEPDVVVLTPDQLEHINQKAVYFVDETNALGTAAAIAGVHDWRRPESDNIILDLASRTVWLHLRLKNPQAQSLRANIELNPVFLEVISAYDRDGHILDQTGAKVEPHRLEAFPTLSFSVAPGVQDFYIAIKSRGNAIGLMLRSDAVQARKDAIDLVMASALIGGLLALMIYHLFMFATHRSRNYALYSMFIAAM